MIEEHARVKSIRGDKAIVEIQRQSGCQGCELKGACGTGSLGRLLGFRPSALEIEHKLKLIPGDRVVIGLQENAYLSAGFLVYLLPLLSLFLFAMVAEFWLAATELVTILAALLGLWSGFVVSAAITRRFFATTLQAQVLRRLL